MKKKEEEEEEEGEEVSDSCATNLPAPGPSYRDSVEETHLYYMFYEGDSKGETWR